MQNLETLKKRLSAIDGRDYGAYQSLKGMYQFEGFTLECYQIPKDPYAPPHTGVYRLRLSLSEPRLIQCSADTRIREIAFRDYLARRFYRESRKVSKEQRGTGFSGVITITQPGQAILDRNCVLLDGETLEIRAFVGLPAKGRRIRSNLAIEMLCKELPEIVGRALFIESFDPQELEDHLKAAESAEYIRSQLELLGLVAFVADGSVLPRQSGTSHQSMPEATAIPLRSPESLRKTITLPDGKAITGMGIPRGVTLIAGGGYHGKSTLLQALELGCYNHIPGDGRERCVSLSETVKIRAYSGRSISGTDISPFIHDLPFQKDTTRFSSNNASGSTSQAAGIMEAVEMGAKVLLMDEDTCATNFMIRDTKMQQLVRKQDEPITPFIDRVNTLFEQQQISTVLVLGGVGDYFEVSDQVIQMVNYQPYDVTEKAHRIARDAAEKRESEAKETCFQRGKRVPGKEEINPCNRYGKQGIYAREIYRLNFGEQVIDLFDLEQLVELSQTKSIGHALAYSRKYMDGTRSLKEVIQLVMDEIEQKGLDIISDRLSGQFSEFRSFELGFTLNRLRGVKMLKG